MSGLEPHGAPDDSGTTRGKTSNEKEAKKDKSTKYPNALGDTCDKDNTTGIEDGQEELLINVQDIPEEEPILKLSLKKIDVSTEDESKQRSMIMYNPEDGDLNEWLQNNKPSEVRSDGVTWIAAVTFERMKEECMEELKEAWETMVVNSAQISHSMVTTFAKQFGVTGGRWVFHVTTDRVDVLWGRVAKAWRDGKLGPNIIQAKVSAVFDPYGSCDSRVISVCNRDSTNEEQVLQVETSLREAKIRCWFYYKPSIYSILGIHSRNRWGLRPTIYHSKYDLKRGESIIQSALLNTWFQNEITGFGDESTTLKDKKKEKLDLKKPTWLKHLPYEA